MLKLGDKTISKLMLGDKAISKAYLGEKLVFQSGGSPSGLKYVSAITFKTSECYIDTGFKSAPNEIIKIRIQEYGNLSNSKTMFTNGGIYLQRSSDGYYMLQSSSMTTKKIDASTIFDIELENTTSARILRVAGEEVRRSAMSSTYYNKCPIVLCGQGQSSGSITKYNWQCHIYEYQYYKDGVLTQDLKPCLDGDNTPSFYDTVSGSVLYNSGTGSLGYIE